MPEWNDNWNEYTHMLFAVDYNNQAKIIGTFFSKSKFEFTTNNKITGTDIMYLKTKDDNDEEYDFNSVDINNLDNTKILLFDINNKPYLVNGNINFNKTQIKASIIAIFHIHTPLAGPVSTTAPAPAPVIAPAPAPARVIAPALAPAHVIADAHQSDNTAIKNLATLGFAGLMPTLGDNSNVDISKIMNQSKELYSNVSTAQNKVISTRIQDLPTETRLKIQDILKEIKSTDNITGGDALSDNEMNQFIQYYINTVHSIIYTPIFYKLTSLNCKNLRDIFSNTQLFTGKYENNIKTILDNNTLINNFTILILFMYVDISILKIATYDNNNQPISLLDLFITNKNKLMYDNYNNNFNCLLGIDANKDANKNTIVYISEFINLLSNLLKNDDINIRNEKNLKYNLYEVLLNIIFLHRETIDNIKEQIRIFQLEDNLEFRNKVDNYIKEINDDNIIAYLKLRNDQDKENLNNARFNININGGNPTDIMIDYMDDNLPYYKLDKDEYVLSDEIKNKVENTTDKTVYDLNRVVDKINILKYKYHYLIGPFTRIFTPKISNADIAKQMKTIKDKIIKEKPIFMIGYGASGAGKTSSLIYFNKTKEDGILINLCNEMAVQGYTEIQVKCKEFYHTTGIGSVDAPKIVNVPNKEGDGINFVFDKGNFVLREEYTHTTHHQYRLLKPDKQQGFETETKFNQGTKLGEVIIHLIDTDRFVKATTNNPNSSRSHTLVFVKLIGKETNGGEETKKIGNIIIGDFAGVENKFACENPNTIKAFLSVKRDNVKNAKGEEIYVPYYSTEAYKGNPDPFGVIETDGQNGGTITRQCISKIEVKDPIYDFDNPVIRKEWNLDKNIIEYYEENDKKNLKMAFNIILEYLNIEVNEVDAKEFKNNLILYSAIIAKKKKLEENLKEKDSQSQNTTSKELSIKQVINHNMKYIKLQLNKLLKDTSINRSYTKKYNVTITRRWSNDEKEINLSTQDRKNFIGKITEKINEILKEYHIYPIPNLEFKPDAFYGMDGTSLSNAYQKDIDNIIENIGEQYKITESLTTIFEKHNLTPDEFTKLNENIFQRHGGFNNLLDLVKDLQLEKKCREENSNVICENRREEGYFINDSLEKVREVIKKILYEKNKDSINITPNFINICLKNYCPQNSNCFNFDIFNTENTSSITGSVIFDEIYRELNKQTPEYTIEKMYKDIIISIFCVFNISKGANNPPPTPYLDINKLKLLFYYEDIVNEPKKTTEFITEAKKIISMIDDEFNDKVSGLKTIKSKINDKLTICGSFADAITAFNAKDGNQQFKDTYNILYKSNITEFIEMIDKNNSVSAIGTLEFLDQIAKFNTVKTLCNSQDTDFISSELLKDFNKSNLMKPLYK